jgi:hypothetical protein
METVDVAYKVQRFAKEKIKDLTSLLISGGIDTMENYKYTVGQIRSYEYILQELSNLLNKKEPSKNAEDYAKYD